MKTIRFAAVAWLACLAVGSADLINGDFETTGGANWQAPGTWGNGGSWRDGGAGDAHSGANGVTFDALTSLSGDGYYVLHQELAAFEGEAWNISGWLKTVNLGNQGSESWIEVQFWDNLSVVLAQTQSSHVTANQDWTQMTMTDFAAPANTASISVRGVVYVHAGGTSQTEFHIFDDFSATVVPEPGTAVLGLLGTVLTFGARAARKRFAQRPLHAGPFHTKG